MASSASTSYVDMIDMVKEYFKNQLGEQFIKEIDNFLLSLSIDDLKSVNKVEVEGEVENEAKADEKSKELIAREKWINIIKNLDTDEKRTAFTLLTIYRNSKVSVLHLSIIEQISDNIVKPYFDKKNNPDDAVTDDEIYTTLLNHVLMFSRLVEHYRRLFESGSLCAINRANSHVILLRDEKRKTIILRVSFSKLGDIVVSQIFEGLYLHTLLGENKTSNQKVEVINYSFTTFDCKNVVMFLFDVEQLIQYLKNLKKTMTVYNLFGNNDIVLDTATTEQLSRTNNSCYTSNFKT
jgi:hypothetical protein